MNRSNPDTPDWRPESSDAVVLRDLKKSFGPKDAVRGLNLRVPSGCFYGVVGPNGAGKSTTLKIATGLLRPDGGAATVVGKDVWSDPSAIKQQIGVVPEDLRLFERLTGRELLEYTATLRRLDPKAANARSEQLLDLLDLTEADGRLVIDYSAGMRKKLATAAAILHRPAILFLDEPFEAVDPISVRTLRALLEQFVAGGGTVVFSSHVMEVVERLCDRVAVFNTGQVVAEGQTAELCAGRRLEEVFAEAVGAEERQVNVDWLAA